MNYRRTRVTRVRRQRPLVTRTNVSGYAVRDYTSDHRPSFPNRNVLSRWVSSRCVDDDDERKSNRRRSARRLRLQTNKDRQHTVAIQLLEYLVKIPYNSYKLQLGNTALYVYILVHSRYVQASSEWWR